MELEEIRGLPFVTAVELHDDGNTGLRFRIAPDGPHPADYGDMVVPSDYVSAVIFSVDDWPNATPSDVQERIAEDWLNWLPNVQPAPVIPDNPEDKAALEERLNAELAGVRAQIAEAERDEALARARHAEGRLREMELTRGQASGAPESTGTPDS